MQAARKAQPAGAFDVVVSASAAGQAHDAAVTAQLLALTKPGGTVVLQEPVSSGSSSPAAVLHRVPLSPACSTLDLTACAFDV